MNTDKAIKLAGSREQLARLLGCAPITTYRWKPNLPKSRMWQLEVLRPEWFKSKEKQA
jgi:hypothetical protein